MNKSLAPIDGLARLAEVVRAQEGYRAVAEALASGRAATIEGAWGSAAALITAALVRERPPVLVAVLAHVGDIDYFVRDLKTFGCEEVAVFPAWEGEPRRYRDEVQATRLRLLARLAGPDAPLVVVASIQSLVQPVPPPGFLRKERVALRVGEQIAEQWLLEWLVQGGYERVDVVQVPGEFCVRGGIVDVFPPNSDDPLRIEFFDDEIESLRYFDVETQRATQLVDAAAILAIKGAGEDFFEVNEEHFAAHLPEGSWWVLIEPHDLRSAARDYLERFTGAKGYFSVDSCFERIYRFPTVHVSCMPLPSVETSWAVRSESVERFSGNVTTIRTELEQVVGPEDEVYIACHNDAERQRLVQVFAGSPLLQQRRLKLEIGQIRAGFRLVLAVEGRTARSRRRGRDREFGQAIVVLGDDELFHRSATLQRARVRRRYESRAIESFLDLNEGDYVVHVAHGIARYRGMELVDRDGTVEEHLVLEFADDVRVLVPASRIDLVQKYVGGRGEAPPLSRVGSAAWARRKQMVAEAVRDLASELLRLQAVRMAMPGFSYGEDSEWQLEFEAAFPYEETPDQLRAMEEIKEDMARPRPMDRLLCGDVGFGKTELAMRAAFKVVDHGKQVAVLVPTTVLAEQHYKTFRERFAAFPFEIEVLSRFKTKAEQRDIVERLKQGTIDIIIGTHRLLQKDVQFHDLGLVIIDEEQRFGVAHKERLKQMRTMVDVLTLTATPIPRTLHMSLLGIRDISVLETPPPDRLAVETRICRWDPELIRMAILRELSRDGQVLFVHNRVYNIREITERVKRIVPEARVRYAHGQMRPRDLEETMLDFFDRKFDVLVATTIIENGLDLPTANTIFINNADEFGLADLHQLRGRVGRYKHRAYAYLIVDPERTLTVDATRRLKAIEEFSDLGAGFKLALRDLEIRGAGNILGPEQSGHIAAVGYELYCQLLEKAVRELKNEPAPEWIPVVLDLPWHTFLPRTYLGDHRQRIELYRRLGSLRTLEQLADFELEVRDRFGPPPLPVQNLFRAARLRILAQPWRIERISLKKNTLVFKFLGSHGPERFRRKLGDRVRFEDEHTGHLPLARSERGIDQLVTLIENILADGAEAAQHAA